MHNFREKLTFGKDIFFNHKERKAGAKNTENFSSLRTLCRTFVISAVNGFLSDYKL
jgi:hypothetical protein